MKLRNKKTGDTFMADLVYQSGPTGPLVVIEAKYYNRNKLFKKYKVEKSNSAEELRLLEWFDNPIKFYRMFKDISQSALSERSGVSQPLLSKYEDGTMPSQENLKKITQALGVPEDEFFPKVMSFYLKRHVEQFVHEYDHSILSAYKILVDLDKKSPIPISVNIEIIPPSNAYRPKEKR